LGALLGTAWTVGLILPPYLISRAIDDGLRRDDFAVLVAWVLAIAGAGALNATLGILRHRTMTFIRADASFRTVEVLSRHVARLGATLGRKFASGEVVSAGTTDIGQVAMVLTITGPGVGAVIAYVVVAVLLWTTSPLLAAVVLLGVPAITLLIGPLLSRLERAESSYRTHQAMLTTRSNDIAAGLRILAGVGGREIFARRYKERSRALVNEGYRVGAVTSRIQALAVGLPAVFLAVVIWLSARMAASGDITVGEMVAVYGYVAMLVVPVSFFVEGAYDLTRGRVAARRIIDVLNLSPEHDAGCSCPPGPSATADLTDEASGLRAPGGRLLGLAAADPSDALAITERLAGYRSSATWSGRSGRVARRTWSGEPLDRICRTELRNRLLLSTNDSYLFAGPVREVLQAGRSRTDAELWAALEVASADDVVMSLGEGELDAVVDAQGRNLSGGQRQRLRLARAIAVDPEILILLEPTSAVDADTETRIVRRVARQRAGRTTVIASTSPIVLHHVELVAFVVAGKVVAVGTHHELLSTGGAYRAMVSRSLADEDDLDQVKG
jgi:ABC-type multidrug transport system fused ATPase/permease subunit